MDINTTSGAKLSLQLREYGQIMTQIKRLLAVQKETLTLGLYSACSGISKYYLYKIASGNRTTFYPRQGKTIYWSNTELEAQRKQISEEIGSKTTTYPATNLAKKGGVSR
ncbi:hypothetical protein [Spirosoma gilvum]